IVVVGVLVTTLALVRVRSFGESSLEYDFSKLRRADTWTNGEGYWGRKMDKLLGVYLTPLVVLTDDEKDAAAVNAKLGTAMKEEPLATMVASTRTLDDVLPTEQPHKVELAA